SPISQISPKDSFTPKWREVGVDKGCDPTSRSLALHSAFACDRAFGGSLSSVLLRMNAQVVPRRFREVDVVVVCRFLDVRERQSTVGIGDVDDLIETRDRVMHMLCVGPWLFALIW